jgi:hypothetical protein
MIPLHTCTPYCDGQRYCVEPGTHTVRWSTTGYRKSSEFKHKIELGYSVEVLRIKLNPDSERNSHHKEQFGMEPDHYWLVTVREKEVAL